MAVGFCDARCHMSASFVSRARVKLCTHEMMCNAAAVQQQYGSQYSPVPELLHSLDKHLATTHTFKNS